MVRDTHPGHLDPAQRLEGLEGAHGLLPRRHNRHVAVPGPHHEFGILPDRECPDGLPFEPGQDRLDIAAVEITPSGVHEGRVGLESTTQHLDQRFLDLRRRFVEGGKSHHLHEVARLEGRVLPGVHADAAVSLLDVEDVPAGAGGDDSLHLDPPAFPRPRIEPVGPAKRLAGQIRCLDGPRSEHRDEVGGRDVESVHLETPAGVGLGSPDPAKPKPGVDPVLKGRRRRVHPGDAGTCISGTGENEMKGIGTVLENGFDDHLQFDPGKVPANIDHLIDGNRGCGRQGGGAQDPDGLFHDHHLR
jgi:hypothetical protein